VIRLRLIWVGKARARSPESQLCERYIKRLRIYANVDELTIKPLAGSNRDPEETRRKESERISAALDSRAWLALCDERGRQMTSPSLAGWLDARALDARPIDFVIGGAMGVAEDLRKRADFMLSFSSMTLPHALARVLLWEQLYRACCIRAGHPYHHEG
jgi:23S rRNA (pseudouridine1915-N3)-methyltransferase